MTTAREREIVIAASDAARAYLLNRADLGAPINYDDLGRAVTTATLKVAEDHFAHDEWKNHCRILIRELEEMTP